VEILANLTVSELFVEKAVHFGAFGRDMQTDEK
jgi:hypothetical protein